MEIVSNIQTFLATHFTKICNPAEWGPSDALSILSYTFSILAFFVIVFRKQFFSKTLKKSPVNKLFDQNTIELSTKYYIEPDCTNNIDPAQDEEPGDIFSYNPKKLFSVVDDYLSKNFRRYLLILADSGMGKTSFVLNYYARNLKRFKRNQHFIEIIPLGIKNPDACIEKINNKPETLLFLDAFDEDILAIVDHRQRIKDLMDKCTDFKQVVITCRTQFFPKDEEIPKETGIIKVGPTKAGDGGFYEFYKIYLSPLTDHQVSQYLKRYYPWNFKKRQRAFEIVKKIPNLKVRPMLLSYIPDIIENDEIITNTAQLYEIMIQKWLVREKRWVKEPNILLRFSEMLAVDIVVNKSKRGFERIPASELSELANQWQIQLENWQITGRSLLNRDAEGNFKFAHRSILEYLFVRSFLKMSADDRPMVDWTDQMKMFCLEASSLKSDNLTKDKLTNSIGIEFVFIPPGTFSMGTSDDDSERYDYERYDYEIMHTVTLSKGFLMATTPVTQSQWQKVMGKNPSYFKENGNNCPVEQVSWEDAQQFIAKLNEMEQTNTYCLPTEAQWEYACRAGSTTRYCFGDDEKMLKDYAWYDKNSGGKTHPVKQKNPNSWGLYDMHGNVWEWCEDWYGNYPNEPVTDPTGPPSGASRVVRGGSWDSYPGDLRSAYRGSYSPGNRGSHIGFRLLRTT